MAISYTINAEPRDDAGKGASRRLRRAGRVPAIVYGGGHPAEAVTLSHNFVVRAADDEAFYTHILNLNADGKSNKVVVRDVQRHPSKPEILHLDFLRVSEKEELRISMPLHFSNEAESPAGKTAGVIISHYLNDVEILCLPKDLPEYIDVDLSEMEPGDNVHLSELKLPEGVKLVDLEHGDEESDAIVVAAQYVRADQGERQLEEIEEPEAEELTDEEAAEAEAEAEVEAEGEGEAEGEDKSDEDEAKTKED
jgi:large subunit ribosomal protein L25